MSNNKDIIKSVKNTIQLLEYLNETKQEIGVREAAKALDISKSTMQRILNTLLTENIIKFDDRSETYSLNYGAMRLSSSLLENNRYLFLLFDEVMIRLRDETDETISITQAIGDKQLIVHQIKSKSLLKWSLPVGFSYSIEKGASGKVKLAFATKNEYEKIMDKLRLEMSESAIKELESELADIRKKGYSITETEIFDSTMGIAVPIFDIKTNELKYVLSLYGPLQRIKAKNVDHIVNMLIEASEEIANKIY